MTFSAWPCSMFNDLRRQSVDDPTIKSISSVEVAHRHRLRAHCLHVGTCRFEVHALKRQFYASGNTDPVLIPGRPRSAGNRRAVRSFGDKIKRNAYCQMSREAGTRERVGRVFVRKDLKMRSRPRWRRYKLSHKDIVHRVQRLRGRLNRQRRCPKVRIFLDAWKVEMTPYLNSNKRTGSWSGQRAMQEALASTKLPCQEPDGIGVLGLEFVQVPSRL